MLDGILIMLGTILLNCLLVWIASPWVFRHWLALPRDGVEPERRRGERRAHPRSHSGPDRRKSGQGF